MPVIIGGVEPFTTVDFPERLAAVLFCSGCPLRCPYCHNPELQNFKSEPFITWERFVEFLIDRKKLLDGVVFSGGEPLAQPDLYESMKFVKDLGYEIGLHTSGVNVSRLEQVLPLVSWVGFDVKTVFDAYETRIPHSRRETVALVKSGVDFECRTTLDPPRHFQKRTAVAGARTGKQRGEDVRFATIPPASVRKRTAGIIGHRRLFHRQGIVGRSARLIQKLHYPPRVKNRRG